jgi:hypothetical protein
MRVSGQRHAPAAIYEYIRGKDFRQYPLERRLGVLEAEARRKIL